MPFEELFVFVPKSPYAAQHYYYYYYIKFPIILSRKFVFTQLLFDINATMQLALSLSLCC